MNLAYKDIIDVPSNKYRVFGRNNITQSFFYVKDCSTPDEAISRVNAEEKEELEANCGMIGTTNFYVINDKGVFLHGLIV